MFLALVEERRLPRPRPLMPLPTYIPGKLEVCRGTVSLKGSIDFRNKRALAIPDLRSEAVSRFSKDAGRFSPKRLQNCLQNFLPTMSFEKNSTNHGMVEKPDPLFVGHFGIQQDEENSLVSHCV